MAKHETHSGKIYVTFTVDKNVKKRFNMACAAIDMNMSEVVQAMMENFIDIGQAMEEKERARLDGAKNLDVPIEVIDSTRLTFKDEENG